MHCAQEENPQLVAPSPAPLISSEHQVPARAASGAKASASSAKPPIMMIRRMELLPIDMTCGK
jgi:hypothetical protein